MSIWIVGLLIAGVITVFFFRRSVKRRTARLQEKWEPSFQTGAFTPGSSRARRSYERGESTSDTGMNSGFFIDTSPAPDAAHFAGGGGDFGGAGASATWGDSGHAAASGGDSGGGGDSGAGGDGGGGGSD
jgi:uncharacterized membrane protein YgcG